MRKYNKVKFKKGYTLIELLLSLAVIFILTVGVFLLLEKIERESVMKDMSYVQLGNQNLREAFDKTPYSQRLGLFLDEEVKREVINIPLNVVDKEGYSTNNSYRLGKHMLLYYNFTNNYGGHTRYQIYLSANGRGNGQEIETPYCMRLINDFISDPYLSRIITNNGTFDLKKTEVTMKEICNNKVNYVSLEFTY